MDVFKAVYTWLIHDPDRMANQQPGTSATAVLARLVDVHQYPAEQHGRFASPQQDKMWLCQLLPQLDDDVHRTPHVCNLVLKQTPVEREHSAQHVSRRSRGQKR
jgi:hypothetical protein